jgi:biopolymer transport protein TolR
MQMSRRAIRMDRHHRRNRQHATLSLVSLMDIFTILVFFLLVSSTEVEILPNPRDLQLPESVAEERARESVVILVTEEQILVQGAAVATVASVMKGDGIVIPELKAALEAQAGRSLVKAEPATDREVTIMGDRELPYRLLKRVMASATAADYGRISLAVNQKSSAPAATPGPATVAAL